jgi:hypothetical protein
MKKQKRWLAGDRIFIIIFIIFDIFLAMLAKNYFQSLNELTSQPNLSTPLAEEIQGIQELSKIAQKGSWDDFERARSEKVAYYLQSNIRPSSGNALYFYPETLPIKSFEKQFVDEELQPGIEALKKAYHTRQEDEASSAYRRLKSRVQNYELGANTDQEGLSEEAKNFLKLYREFTVITKKLHEPQLQQQDLLLHHR